MKGDEASCLACGMDGYISKPIRTAELMAILERLVPAKLHREPKHCLSADQVTL
jgi:CheY-like chemotaxis protein